MLFSVSETLLLSHCFSFVFATLAVPPRSPLPSAPSLPPSLLALFRVLMSVWLCWLTISLPLSAALPPHISQEHGDLPVLLAVGHSTESNVWCIVDAEESEQWLSEQPWSQHEGHQPRTGEWSGPSTPSVPVALTKSLHRRRHDSRGVQ